MIYRPYLQQGFLQSIKIHEMGKSTATSANLLTCHIGFLPRPWSSSGAALELQAPKRSRWVVFPDVTWGASQSEMSLRGVWGDGTKAGKQTDSWANFCIFEGF